MATELVELILEKVDKFGKINSLNLANEIKVDHQKIIGAIKSLETLDDVIYVEQISEKKWEPTAEGQHVIEHGSHEAAVYNSIPNDVGISQADIMKSVAYAKVGFSKALAAGWIKIDKTSGKPIVTKNKTSIQDTTQADLNNINQLDDKIKANYKKRKLVQEIVIKSFDIKKANNFTLKIEKQEADLTSDLMINDAWKDKKFKAYNFNALGAALDVGHLHPLLKVRSEFRKIFLEMGFTEMPTNNFVESSFWNFDALFQPQQHPARDAHDTFFISDPKITKYLPQNYMEKVKKVHSKGGYGSQGYCYDWKIQEAQKNLLRTHTTAVSARMLYNLMQQGQFKPVKYFSIDRVFRNETLDATHLAEFQQVEGVIADYNLTLGDLIGTLYQFFKKLGIDKLEFKPAYNPYTEPSMEIFCYHEGLEKWIEIGNSGVFRPEMLLPMGLPPNVNVIAWGLSLERPTMIKYKLNNIRDLVGPKVDLQMVYNNPICRLEKKENSSQINKLLNNNNNNNNNRGLPITFKCRGKINKEQLVIFCDPKYPIKWLGSLLDKTKELFTLSMSIHLHSTVKNLSNEIFNYYGHHEDDDDDDDDDAVVKIHFIWKNNIGIDPIMNLNSTDCIFGQVNVARYFNRLIESVDPSVLVYESMGSIYSCEINKIIDQIHLYLHSGKTIKEISCLLGKKTNVPLLDRPSIIDIILEST